MYSHVPGRSYIRYFSSIVLIFALLLFSILLGWIYFSTSQAIKEQQRVSIDLNNRNSARVLDSRKQQLQETLEQMTSRYVWSVGRGTDDPQQVLNGIVNRDKGRFRLDMLRFVSADHKHSAIADSPFFDFQGLDTMLYGSQEHHSGNAHILSVGTGDHKLWIIVSEKKLIDSQSGRVLGTLLGGVVLNDNVPLCREILKRSSGEYVSLAAGNTIVSSSSPLPDRIQKVVQGKALETGTISVRASQTEMWQVSISRYEETDGIPLYTILVYKDTLQAQLRQTMLYSGGVVALLTIGLFFLFGGFFSGQTRQEISNLLDFTKAAVNNDEHNTYSLGMFCEFNQIGMAVEEMLKSLDEASEKLVEAKDKAEEASHTKSVFLASMSHELRTPLNAILGYGQLMSDDSTLSRKQRGKIRVMYQAGDHLLRLINDILDLSKIEAGKLNLLEKEFALAPFFEGIVDVIRVRSEEKDIGFFYETPDGLPGSIVADELRLRQVIFNLLANAVKFTDKGFCSFKVEVKPLREENIQLKISVTDTGPGIDPVMQEKIFDPFQQSGERLKYSEGAGLGLAISRQLITEMGGEIVVLSPVRTDPPDGEGVGSRFSFTLDVKSSNREIVAVGRSQAVTGYHCINSEEEQIIKILIVDDQLLNRKVLKDILEPLGFVIEEATDGSEVLAVSESFRPDLILMDLQMVEVDGAEATRRLKASTNLSGIPVVAVTAAVAVHSEQTHASQEETGFCDCMYKPFQIDELLRILAKHLDLEWKRDQSGKVEKTAVAFVVPPDSVLKNLRQLSEHGDISGLEEVAQEIQELESGRYRAFAEHLLELVENVELIRIEKFINQ